jgi:hypothetical protein
MKRFIEGVDRGQSTLFPERLDDWVGEDNPVRVIDVFVDELDLGGLGFDRVEPQALELQRSPDAWGSAGRACTASSGQLKV